MKKIYLVMLLTIAISSVSFGQVSCGMIAMPENWYFDGGYTPNDYILQIYTVANPNNIWQIGKPQKTSINSAYSSPNAIITDTINHYPPNNTSSFIFKHIDRGGYSTPHSAELAGYYKVNSDSLKDYGTMEISLDHGNTWINLVTDTTYCSYYNWVTPKPILTGKSNGWTNFWVRLANLGNAFNVNWGDTILFKFTFISDSISDTLDGLAFDNFQFCDGVEGIDETLNDNIIAVYPNPTNDLLYINRRKNSMNETVQIFNYTGQLLYEDKNFISKSIDIRKLNLSNGLFFIKYSDTKSYSIKKFLVQH